MKLTPAQLQALDIDRNVIIEAGAGSGKTTIMIARFFKLLATHSDLDPCKILVITFTKLAALELKQRVQDHLLSHSTPLPPQRYQQILYALHRLSFSTIDGFCAKLLRDMPLLAGVDPHFTVLSEEESTRHYDAAIDLTLRQLAHTHDSQYAELLETYSKPQVKRLLQTLRYQNRHGDDCGKQQELRYHQALVLCNNHTADTGGHLDYRRTKQAIMYTKALLKMDAMVKSAYGDRKYQESALDYSDLMSKALEVMTHQDAMRYIQENYHYIFVDEFQDTSILQWQLVQQLCDAFDPFSKKKLCVVGDIKQSIYQFRGAEPALFAQLLGTTYPEHETQIVHLADNFRSAPDIIQFVNDLFSQLLTTGDRPIPYTPLQAHYSSPGQVECSFLEPGSKVGDECEQIYCWILAQQQAGVNDVDIAVLSRKRAPLKKLQQYLQERDVSVILHGEADYFQRQSCIDIITMAQTMLNPQDAVSIVGVLASPLGGLRQDEIYMLTESAISLKITIYQTINNINNNDFPPLWEMVSQTRQLVIKDTVAWVIQWIAMARHRPLYDIVMDIIDQRPNYCLTALSYLIDHIKQLESATSSRAVLWEQLRQLPYHSSRYTDAQTDAVGVNVMTIHQSKGLEFKSVALMGCHGSFNFSKSDPLIVSSQGVGVSLSSRDESGTNHLKSVLTQQLIPDVVAEEKRLFYVACTRAIDALLLSGIRSESVRDNPPCSFLDLIAQGATVTPEGICVNGRQYGPFKFAALGLPQASSVTDLPLPPADTVGVATAPPIKWDTEIKKCQIMTFSVGDIELLLDDPGQYRCRSLHQTLKSHGKESFDALEMTAIRQGVMIHHVVAYWIRHQCDAETAWHAALGHWGCGGEDARLSEMVTQTLTALGPYNHPTTRTEWPFTVQLLDRYRVNGRIDLWSVIDGQVTIIDIKTDAVTADQVPQRVDGYLTQLCLYVMAVAGYLQVEIDQIQCYCYFTQCDIWHQVQVTQADIDQLTAAIDSIDFTFRASSCVNHLGPPVLAEGLRNKYDG